MLGRGRRKACGWAASLAESAVISPVPDIACYPESHGISGRQQAKPRWYQVQRVAGPDRFR